MSDPIDALFRIDGKTAVITDSGALSSIDVAPLLARAGATVVIADLDPDATSSLAERIVADGGRATGIPTDITSEDSVAALFAAVRQQFGRCDILVNCAGLTANAPITETSMAHYDEVQDINQRSTFMLMREAVRLMTEVGEGGRIVNVTTIGSIHPTLHGNAAYGASRAGVTAMTRALAYDHASDGIRANLVLPGAVQGKTRFHEDILPRLTSGQLSGAAVDDPRRMAFGMGNGQDIATAVLYLVGPSSTYITGQSIVLDGGFLLT